MCISHNTEMLLNCFYVLIYLPLVYVLKNKYKTAILSLSGCYSLKEGLTIFCLPGSIPCASSVFSSFFKTWHRHMYIAIISSEMK